MNEILLEYYQGKTKELIKCESYLREIIKAANTDAKSGIFGSNTLTKKNEWNNKLERELKNMFKAKDVNIYWQDDATNAMTLTPMAITIFDSNVNRLAGRPINRKITIVAYTDLITKANVNERELLALLLHEIGHNFYCCPIMFGFNLFALVVSSPVALLMAFLNNLIQKASYSITDFLKSELPLIYNIITGFSGFIIDISQFIKPVNYLQSLAHRLSSYVANPLNLINVFTGYGWEKGADSFATMYGYGPDLASALRKMTISEKSIYGRVTSQGGTVASIFVDLNELACDIIAMMMLDPHPSHNQRAAAMLTKLKKDLQTNAYPPEVKKDLQNEIERMEKIYKIVNTNGTKSNTQMRQNWYNFINTITKDHSDFRELFGFYYDSFLF